MAHRGHYSQASLPFSKGRPGVAAMLSLAPRGKSSSSKMDAFVRRPWPGETPRRDQDPPARRRRGKDPRFNQEVSPTCDCDVCYSFFLSVS